jgi:histidine ammonia-lyase
MTVLLDGRTLSAAALARIAEGAPVALCQTARRRMEASCARVDPVAASRALADKWRWLTDHAAPESPDEQVRAFLRGHCAGVGPPLPPRLARAMVAARLNALAVGASGVRPELVDAIAAQLSAGVAPVVPGRGSAGAAGCPQLAHAAWVCCGFGGEAWRDGERVPGPVALAGLPRVLPTPKEAPSLINGSTLATARGALACALASTLLETAEAAAALSFEVVRADLGCLSEPALAARGHQGAVEVARALRSRLDGSTLCREGLKPDPFSIRCAPAVLGAAREAFAHIAAIIERELNGATDNPVVCDDGSLVDAGNFHGAPVALSLDYLKVALTQVASISERRTFRMTYGQLSGLPSFLLQSSGIDSGLMLAQYTAASLVSECKGLAHPASVDSVPTVQHREDHVSMAAVAAEGAERVAECLADVLAIELLCGAQGLDFHLAGEGVDPDGRPTRSERATPGRGTRATYERVRERVDRWVDDRVLHPDLRALGSAVRAGAFTARVGGPGGDGPGSRG